MKVDITQLLIIFDELLASATDEERGVYWFKAIRSDGIRITLVLSLYESTADVVVANNNHLVLADVSMKECSEVRVLSESQRQLEITHENMSARCSLFLDGDPILGYAE